MLSEGSFNSAADQAAAAEIPTNPLDALADILLSEIAAGFQSLASIASEHKIPYPKFTLWLLKPETQQKLTDLSTAVASAARLTATSALPDIVRNLKATVEQLSAQSQSLIAPANADPLKLQALALRRHRAVISASALLYRISRFTVPSPPCHRPPSRSDAIGAPAPPPRGGGGGAAAGGGNVPLLPSSTGSSTAFSSASSSASPAASLPRLTDFDRFDDLSRATEIQARRVLISVQSRARGTDVPGTANAALIADHTEPNHLAAQDALDELIAPVNPGSAAAYEPPMPVDEAIEVLIEDFGLNDDQAREFRADPKNWLREHRHEFLGDSFVFDDDRSADDG